MQGPQSIETSELDIFAHNAYHQLMIRCARHGRLEAAKHIVCMAVKYAG